MESKQSFANKIHYETLAEAWRSGRELPPEVSEWSVLTAEPGGVDYAETTLGDKTALWVRPKLAAKDRVMLYLHGGGYVIGSPADYRDMVPRIARAAGARALVVDYRLAPEHPHPAAVDDAVGAARKDARVVPVDSGR